MQSWAAQELQTAALGDPRRGRRLVTLVEALAAQPAANVPRACGSWAATNGAYRLWNHPHLTADALRAAPIDATRQRLRALPCVRAVQDATTLDWSHHPGATGLGPLNASGRQGMHVEERSLILSMLSTRPLNASGRQGMHVPSTLAVTADGAPLSLLDQPVWTRDPTTTGRRRTRRPRPTAAQERQRWRDARRARMPRLLADRTIVTIADRAADIDDVFAQERRSGAAVLIRAAHHRNVTHAARDLGDAVRAAPGQRRRTLAVGRPPLRAPREAQLEVRWVARAMLPPRRQVSAPARILCRSARCS